MSPLKLLLIFIAVIVAIWLLRRLFRPNSGEYNEAVEIHQQLRYLTNKPMELTQGLVSMVRLCQLDIQKSPKSGDSYVMLASAYGMLANRYGQTMIYNYCMPRAYAVIKYWKDHPMHTRNRGNGNVIHQDMMESVEWAINYPGMPVETVRDLRSIGRGTDRIFLSSAIDPNSIDEVTHVVESEVIADIALRMMDANEDEAAIKLCDEYLAHSPDAFRVLYARSLVREANKQYDLALIDINKAIEIAPPKGYLHGTRGDIYFKLSDFDKALPDLDTCIQLSPNSHPAYIFRGAIRKFKGESGSAMEDFQKYFSIMIDLDSKESVIEAAKSTVMILDFASAMIAVEYTRHAVRDGNMTPENAPEQLALLTGGALGS